MTKFIVFHRSDLLNSKIWTGYRPDWRSEYRSRMILFLRTVHGLPCFIVMQRMVAWAMELKKRGQFQPVPFYFWIDGVQIVFDEMLEWYEPFLKWSCTPFDRQYCPPSHMAECKGNGTQFVLEKKPNTK